MCRPKLHERASRCWVVLGNWERAEAEALQAVSSLREAGTTEDAQKKLLANCYKLLEDIRGQMKARQNGSCGEEKINGIKNGHYQKTAVDTQQIMNGHNPERAVDTKQIKNGHNQETDKALEQNDKATNGLCEAEAFLRYRCRTNEDTEKDKEEALNKQITNGEPGTQTAKNIIDVRDWDQEELIEERNVNVPAFSSAVEIR